MPDFSTLIRTWYKDHKRDLPWRDTNNPYYIWLSEIILQQTRVEQGMPYYNNFLTQYPTIDDLAMAEEKEVLKSWEGLGYYSRARNLHHTAKLISGERQGKFPDTYAELIKLKGIGPYTAAAIASFSFNECVPVVDGNVYRLLSRVFDIQTDINSSQGQKLFKKLAEELISTTFPAEHNQAIMELGALVCQPVIPRCPECPLSIKCLALANNTVKLRPVKSKKKKPYARYFIHLVFWDGTKTIILQRRNKDIWQNLYEFPGIEVKETEDHQPHLDPYGSPMKVISLKPHLLSHQRINATFYVFNLLPEIQDENWELVDISEIHTFPFSQLTNKFLHGKFVF